MKPTTQTILHDPENGLHGNCFSAVLASLLHLPIGSIPVFSDSEDWRKEVNDFLRPYGLAYMIVSDFDTYCEENGISGCHHQVAGFTKRSGDVWHACVAADGHLIFDPHPSRDGLTEAKAHGVFLTLHPWRLTEPKHDGRQDLAPGQMRCPRCNFRLIRSALNTKTGAISDGSSQSEPCPNGCGPLWPVTWREEAQDLAHVAHTANERTSAAKRKVQVLRKALIALVGADTPEDLKQLEATIRMLPVPDSDRAITINAIQALLQTADEPSHVVASSWDGDRP